jgi:hypothetical protein
MNYWGGADSFRSPFGDWTLCQNHRRPVERTKAAQHTRSSSWIWHVWEIETPQSINNWMKRKLYAVCAPSPSSASCSMEKSMRKKFNMLIKFTQKSIFFLILSLYLFFWGKTFDCINFVAFVFRAAAAAAWKRELSWKFVLKLSDKYVFCCCF